MAVVFDVTFFLIAVPAVIFAGISKGGFGSGAAFAATPLLALVLEPGAAIGLLLPLLMLMDVGALKPYWKKWSWPEAKALLIGSLPGIALAGVFYKAADPDLFRLLIGAIAILFVAYQLAKRAGWMSQNPRPLPRGSGVVAGCVAGFTSFISHAGGPPAAVYLLSQGLNKTTYQATTVLVFWGINLIKFVPYAGLGIFSKATLMADLILAPVALLGVWLGVKGHNALSEKGFFAITYVFLVLTGSKLIWDALS